MSYAKDVQWTLDELRSEREAMEAEVAEARARHEPVLAELRERLEEETRKLLADPGGLGREPEEVEEERREPTPPAKAKRARKPKAPPPERERCVVCGAPREVWAEDKDALCSRCSGNRHEREWAKTSKHDTYENTDSEGVEVVRCVDCDAPAGSPPAGCGNPRAHAPAQGDLLGTP